MADFTSILNLRKPAQDDSVSVVSDLDLNYDLIDQQWQAVTPTLITADATRSVGTVTIVARADHNHGGLSTAEPVDVGDVNAEGTSSAVSRADHVHHAAQSFLNQVEVLTLDAGTAEHSDVFIPDALATANLTLRGRTPRGGVLPSHNHTGSVADSSAASHSHSGSVALSANATHAHSGSDSAADSGTHGHAGSTVSTVSNHSHSASSASEGGHSHTVSGVSVNHTHNVSVLTESSHQHTVRSDSVTPGLAMVTTAWGGANAQTTQTNTGHNHSTTVSVETADHFHNATGGAHTHAVTVSSDGGAHGHTPTIASASTAHDHTLTIASDNAAHGHTLSMQFESTTHGHTTTITSQGVGGSLTASRPSGVTVKINGSDVTSALGGPWGSSGADWDQVDLDIESYLTPEQWNRIEVTSSTVGLLKVHITARLA